MTPNVRGWSVAALAALLWAGCGSDPPLGAQIGMQAPLGNLCPDASPPPAQCGQSPLALTRDVVLLRAGDGFVLAGLDGHKVRWGQLSSTGTLSGETAFDLPVDELPATRAGQDPLGPLLAITSKVTPGDQLVVVMGVLQQNTTDHYEIHALTYDLGSQSATSDQILGVQAAAANSGAIRLKVGSSPDGTRAIVLWGVEGQLAPIRYQMLGADGVLVGGQGKLNDNPGNPNAIPLWTCLDTTQNAPDLGVTWVESPNPQHPLQSAWHRFEMDDDGSTGTETIIYMKYDVSDCRIVSTPTGGGYLLAWQNNASNGGTYFANLTAPPPDAGSGTDEDVNMRPLLASASYGGYAQMPKLEWIAPAGYDLTIGLARSDGPRVARFDSYADPMGKTLYLPSTAGNTGPVSAWVGADAVYLTYLDMPGPSTGVDAAVPAGSQRFVVTVLSPATMH